MPPQQIGESVSPPVPPSALHIRMLILLGNGETCETIAKEVHLSTRSVYREIAKLKLTIGAPTIAALIAAASRHGWLDTHPATEANQPDTRRTQQDCQLAGRVIPAPGSAEPLLF